MKITILGSGHGVPEAHKQCTSILFEVGGSYYFIDAGCDISMELANRRIHPNGVKAIFITHPHTDHINGLYSFLSLLGWYYTKSNPEMFAEELILNHAYVVVTNVTATINIAMILMNVFLSSLTFINYLLYRD